MTQILCLLLVYLQFRSWYWNPPGQFLCQLMVFQVPLKPLDNDCLPRWTQTGENGKNKSVKQYTMIRIARSRQKFRNQNWRYGYRNNHFGLNADFSGLHIFSGTIPVFRIIQGHFQGHQQFQGFSGFSEVADHPVVMNLGEKTWKLFIKGLQSVRYLGPKIWELVPNNIKYCNLSSNLKK